VRGSLLVTGGLLPRGAGVTHALHSSERMDWRTPAWFLDLVRKCSPEGRIALDPATHWSNPTDAVIFYAPTTAESWGVDIPGWAGPCGLRGSWARASDRLRFTNPPYGEHLDGEIDPDRPVYRTNKETKVREIVGYGVGWAAKLAADTGAGVTLVPNRTETEWWERLFYGSHLVLFVKRRIPFVNPDTGKAGQSPNHGSTVFYRGDRPDLFARAFAGRGILNPGGLCP
jgi:hypothetical protein